MRRVPINFLSLSLSTHYFKKISFKTQTEHTWLFGLFSTHNVAFNLRWFSSTQIFFLGRTLHEESMLLLICQITNKTHIETRTSYMTKRPNRNTTEISKSKQKVLKNQQQQWKMNESTKDWILWRPDSHQADIPVSSSSSAPPPSLCFCWTRPPPPSTETIGYFKNILIHKTS